jgi:DNA-directed RNA polymerase subunit RPC12/RpoP
MLIRADVKCYYCGHVSGQIEGDPDTTRRWSYRSRSGQRVVTPLRGRRIRCGRCDGPVFLDEVESVRPSRDRQPELVGARN